MKLRENKRVAVASRIANSCVEQAIIVIVIVASVKCEYVIVIVVRGLLFIFRD